MKQEKLTQKQMFALFYDELTEHLQGSDYNGGMEYAHRWGFDTHAVSNWINSGASQYSFRIKIDPKIDSAEAAEICRTADIFECPHCNNVSFFDRGEIREDKTSCESCLKTMKLYSRGVK